MYILYLDESGNPDEPADKHFVLGGLAVFERTTFYLTRAVDELQEKYFPTAPPVDFHANVIRSGKGFWRGVPESTRDNVLTDIGKLLAGANDPGMVLFGAVIEKSSSIYGEDAVRRATEECCRRFDIFLMKRRNQSGDTQRGLLVFAEGRFDQRAMVWVRDFRKLGTSWGILKNLSDLPFFTSAKDSRLVQMADYVCHALFQLYERKNPKYLRPIISRFDKKMGTLHGLTHVTADPVNCKCPACSSRRVPGDFGASMK